MKHLAILYFLVSVLVITSYGQQKDSIANNEIVCYFEPPASFPGGYEALYSFVMKTLKYPVGSEEYVGNIFIAFIVNEDGTLTDFEIMKGLCGACDKSALEALKKMPNWIPAKINNKPIRAKMVIPIKYDFKGRSTTRS